MQCPKCNNNLPPLRIWLISRWTPLRCDRCGTNLTRAVDKQFFIISVLLFAGIFLFISTPFFLIAYLFGVMLVDSYTVRLVPDEGESPENKRQSS